MHIIINSTDGNPPGKLADVELHFQESDGLLDGLKLIGFGLWEHRARSAGETTRYNLTVPARQYSVDGERRSFGLLRPIMDGAAFDRLRAAVIDAWTQYQAEQNAPADAIETLVLDATAPQPAYRITPSAAVPLIDQQGQRIDPRELTARHSADCACRICKIAGPVPLRDPITGRHIPKTWTRTDPALDF